MTTLALSVDAPPAAAARQTVFYGPDGRVPVPESGKTPVKAFGAAITELVANVAAGISEHPTDMRFGREVVQILARAEAALG